MNFTVFCVIKNEWMCAFIIAIVDHYRLIYFKSKKDKNIDKANMINHLNSIDLIRKMPQLAVDKSLAFSCVKVLNYNEILFFYIFR